MSKIMSMPLVYEDKEWQTIVRICPLREELHLRVNILNNKLARKLGSSDLFMFRNGKVMSYFGDADKNLQNALQLTVKKLLSLYTDQYIV